MKRQWRDFISKSIHTREIKTNAPLMDLQRTTYRSPHCRRTVNTHVSIILAERGGTRQWSHPNPCMVDEMDHKIQSDEC